VMRALGASRANIFRIVSTEAALISLLGAVVGVAAAFFFMGLVENMVRAHLPFAPSQRLLNWDWTLAFACVAGGGLLGALAALGPAWRAADLPPILAMRKKEV
jgi:putative ABC transport system permease protein